MKGWRIAWMYQNITIIDATHCFYPATDMNKWLLFCHMYIVSYCISNHKLYIPQKIRFIEMKRALHTKHVKRMIFHSWMFAGIYVAHFCCCTWKSCTSYIACCSFLWGNTCTLRRRMLLCSSNNIFFKQRIRPSALVP